MISHLLNNRIPSTCQKLPMQDINNRHAPHIRPIPIRNTCDTVQYLDDIIWKIFEHVIVLGCFVCKFRRGSVSEWCSLFVWFVCQYLHSGLSKLLSPVFTFATFASNLVSWSIGFRVFLGACVVPGDFRRYPCRSLAGEKFSGSCAAMQPFPEIQYPNTSPKSSTNVVQSYFLLHILMSFLFKAFFFRFAVDRKNWMKSSISSPQGQWIHCFDSKLKRLENCSWQERVSILDVCPQVFTDPTDAVLPDDLRDLAKWFGFQG